MGTRYNIIGGAGDITFQIPKTIKHKEARKVICDIVRELNECGELTAGDIPQLHRMATAYDCYLECVEVVSAQGLTMRNLKGETVKRPEANIMRESWSQYLDIAKEYGFTPRSKKMTRGTVESKDDTPIDDFFRGK